VYKNLQEIINIFAYLHEFFKWYAKCLKNGSEPWKYIKFIIDNTWVLLSALLVFIMHLGFSSLEVGLTRQKNTVKCFVQESFYY